MKQQIYNTGIYLRLSCDDDVHGESVSISNQRQMLTQYCREHGLRLVDEYVDDGYSGTNFDRPSFQRMLDDIENGKINCVVTKDLSRLGRNYILTGQYTEIYFPSKNVRYIAVSDGVDSEKGESEIAPFLNILNEMHARQTSKKVKAAMKVRFENGARSGYCAPYGYLKHESIKGKIVPDEETAWVVRKIFTLAATGLGPNKIRRALESEKIPSPSWRQYEKLVSRGEYTRAVDLNGPVGTGAGSCFAKETLREKRTDSDLCGIASMRRLQKRYEIEGDKI